MSNLPTAFMAIIGKNNEPLIIRNYLDESLKIDLEFAAFSALDYIQEKTKQMSNELHLGLLYSLFLGEYEINIYASVANTKYKFLIFKNVSDAFQNPNDENFMKPALDQLTHAYYKLLLNPFFDGNHDEANPLIQTFFKNIDKIAH